MTSYREPIKIIITASPAELRALADKMEKEAPSTTWGKSTFIDFLAHAEDYQVHLHFDQERTKGSMNYKGEK